MEFKPKYDGTKPVYIQEGANIIEAYITLIVVKQYFDTARGVLMQPQPPAGYTVVYDLLYQPEGITASTVTRREEQIFEKPEDIAAAIVAKFNADKAEREKTRAEAAEHAKK